MIRFDEIEPNVVPNFKGGEKEDRMHVFADDRNRIMRHHLVPGASIGMHTHETDFEIIYILSGEGKSVLNGVDERVHPGDCIYCPQGGSHMLANDGDKELVFFAVVSQVG